MAVVNNNSLKWLFAIHAFAAMFFAVAMLALGGTSDGPRVSAPTNVRLANSPRKPPGICAPEDNPTEADSKKVPTGEATGGPRVAPSKELRPTQYFLERVEALRSRHTGKQYCNEETEDDVRFWEEKLAQRRAEAGESTGYTATVSGTVHGPDGLALPGANIGANWRVFFADGVEDVEQECTRAHTAFTDTNGGFAIPLMFNVLALQRVRVTLSASRHGYAHAEWVGVVPNGSSLNSIQLELGATGSVRGRVVTYDARPAVGATVRYGSVGLGDGQSATADASGSFFLSELPAEPCVLEAELPDGSHGSTVLLVRPNEIFELSAPILLTAPNACLLLIDEHGYPVVARALAEFASGVNPDTFARRYDGSGCLDTKGNVEHWTGGNTEDGKLYYRLTKNDRWKLTVWADGYEISDTLEIEISDLTLAVPITVRLKRAAKAEK